MGNIIHTIDDFFFQFLDITLIFYLCFSLYKFRFHPAHKKIAIICTSVCFGLLYKLLLTFIDYLNLISYQSLANPRQPDDLLILGDFSITPIPLILYSLLIVFIFTHGNRLDELLLIMLFTPSSDMIRILGYYLSRLLPAFIQEDTVYIMRTLFSFVFLIFITWLFYKYFQMLHNNPRQSYRVYTCIAALSMNFFYILIKHNISQISFATLIFVLMLIILIFFFLLMEKIIQNYNNNLRLQFQEKIEESNRQTIIEMENATQEIRRWRHEYQNQLLLFMSYCEESRYSELQESLETALQKLPHLEKRIRTGNSELDLILNHKFSECTKQGIDLLIQVSIPEQLNFRKEDIFSLLNNLLNNAIEAAKKTPSPYIQLTISPAKNYLLFQIRNSCIGNVLEENPELQTTKSDKLFHGIGMSVIRSVVNKYDGIINFSQDDEIFQTKVLLKCKRSEPMSFT